MKPRHLTLQQATAIRDHIQKHFPEEPELLADMIEGETDLYEWMQWLESKRSHDAMLLEGLKKLQSDLAARKKRLDTREAEWRRMGLELMESSGQPKIELPSATWSRRVVKSKRKVLDESLLPDDCVKIVRKPDMAAINALPELPDGVGMDNGGASVTVRVK